MSLHKNKFSGWYVHSKVKKLMKINTELTVGKVRTSGGKINGFQQELNDELQQKIDKWWFNTIKMDYQSFRKNIPK